MGLGDVLGKLNLIRQIEKEAREPGFSFKVMAWKGAKAVAYTLVGFVAVAVAGWLMNTPAITELLRDAGVPDAMAGACAMAFLWIGRSIMNAAANSKTADSPVDGQPVNVQTAERSGPVLTTEAQFDAWLKRYNQLRAQNVGFEDARKIALAYVTGLGLK